MDTVLRILLAMYLTRVACCINDANVLALYKKWFTGDGTYYGRTDSGLCTLNVPHLPPVARRVDKLVALNRPQMFGSSGCGMCIKVVGSGQGLGHNPISGTFIAYVKDLCPECHAGSVDLAENGDGRWKISMRSVQCPVGNTKIDYTLQGSNRWYLKLQVRNERMPATTVEMYQPKSRRWNTLKRTRDGFWNLGYGAERPIRLPFYVRLHAPNGQVLVDKVRVYNMGYKGVIRGNGVQFPVDYNLP